MRAATVIGLIDKLRTRKHNYRSAFAPGSPAHAALVDLGKYCRSFESDVIDHDRALVAMGLRRAYFRIIDHLQFEPDELMQLYKATKLGDE